VPFEVAKQRLTEVFPKRFVNCGEVDISRGTAYDPKPAECAVAALKARKAFVVTKKWGSVSRVLFRNEHGGDFEFTFVDGDLKSNGGAVFTLETCLFQAEYFKTDLQCRYFVQPSL